MRKDSPACPLLPHPQTAQRPARGGRWKIYRTRHAAKISRSCNTPPARRAHPKGVVLTHANLLANIHSIVAGVDIHPDDACVSLAAAVSRHGIDRGLVRSALHRHSADRDVAAGIFERGRSAGCAPFTKHRATISPAPNFAYELCVRKIADKDLEGLDLSSWRAATNGAEPVRAETLERFAARFAPYSFNREALMPVYGLAEASLGDFRAAASATGYKVDRIERAAFESEGRAIPAGAADVRAARIRERRQAVAWRGSSHRRRRRPEFGRAPGRPAAGSAALRRPAATIEIPQRRAT